MKYLSRGDDGIVRVVPLLLVIVGIGIISFLLIATTAPFKGGLNNIFPKPYSHAANTTFVTRVGPDLFVSGSRMRFVGSNSFGSFGYSWDNGCCGTLPRPNLPTHAFIDEALNKAELMGANAVISFAALSVGCADNSGIKTGPSVNTNCIEPSLNIFYDGTNGHPNNYEPFDYAISNAKNHNIRFLVPLVDNYRYYDGGKYTYLAWGGVSNTNNGINFFLDPTVIQDYKNHIANVLNHVNQYTGVTYKDDPTIMAWELGSEMTICDGFTTSGCQTWPQSNSYSNWAENIAANIKSIDKNHLVSDGLYGYYLSQENQSAAALYSSPSIDMFFDHAYSDQQSPIYLVNEGNLVRSYGKAFFVGEYTWTDHVGNTALNWTLPQMISAIENSNINGDLFWQLVPQSVGNEGAGLELHYPGDTPDMQNRAQQLSAHALVMCPASGTCRNGIATPGPTPTISPSSIPPKGNFDSADCTQFKGWICDQNDYNQSLTVNFYKDGPFGMGTFIGAAVANIVRPDLITANVCGGTGNHGFSAPLPQSVKDGQTHQIYAYALDFPASTNNPLLSSNPKTIQCASVTPTPTATSSISPTSTPSPTPSCPKGPLGDIDCNGKIDLFDYNVIVTNFGKTGTSIPGDINNSGKVDLFDYNILVTNYGK